MLQLQKSLKFWTVVLLGLFYISLRCDARAVNVSNTWTMPQEGLNVFYRFFRDRISWFEADAVCQFHHANLVTVDNSFQFDATRDLLRELDVNDIVWIGLMRPQNSDRFMWSNSRPLVTDTGYWAESLPLMDAPLCAVIDPIRDYRWHALRCGGPETASFLCEMPVPAWADACILKDMPNLTMQYMADTASIELIRNCQEEGLLRQTCKGKEDRESAIRELICPKERLEAQRINDITNSHFKSLQIINSIRTDNNENNDIELLPLVPNYGTGQRQVITEPNTVQRLIEKFNVDEVMQADEPASVSSYSIPDEIPIPVKKSAKKVAINEENIKNAKGHQQQQQQQQKRKTNVHNEKRKPLELADMMMGDQPHGEPEFMENVPEELKQHKLHEHHEDGSVDDDEDDDDADVTNEVLEHLPHKKKILPQDLKTMPSIIEHGEQQQQPQSQNQHQPKSQKKITATTDDASILATTTTTMTTTTTTKATAITTLPRTTIATDKSTVMPITVTATTTATAKTTKPISGMPYANASPAPVASATARAGKASGSDMASATSPSSTTTTTAATTVTMAITTAATPTATSSNGSTSVTSVTTKAPSVLRTHESHTSTPGQSATIGHPMHPQQQQRSSSSSNIDDSQHLLTQQQQQQQQPLLQEQQLQEHGHVKESADNSHFIPPMLLVKSHYVPPVKHDHNAQAFAEHEQQQHGQRSHNEKHNQQQQQQHHREILDVAASTDTSHATATMSTLATLTATKAIADPNTAAAATATATAAVAANANADSETHANIISASSNIKNVADNAAGILAKEQQQHSIAGATATTITPSVTPTANMRNERMPGNEKNKDNIAATATATATATTTTATIAELASIDNHREMTTSKPHSTASEVILTTTTTAAAKKSTKSATTIDIASATTTIAAADATLMVAAMANPNAKATELSMTTPASEAHKTNNAPIATTTTTSASAIPTAGIAETAEAAETQTAAKPSRKPASASVEITATTAATSTSDIVQKPGDATATAAIATTKMTPSTARKSAAQNAATTKAPLASTTIAAGKVTDDEAAETAAATKTEATTTAATAAASNEEELGTAATTRRNFLRAETETPFKPNRRRSLTKPETPSYFKKILG